MMKIDTQAPDVLHQDYPPAPWRLTGGLYGSLWSVPKTRFSATLPKGLEPLINFGRIGVFAGFVDYREGSALVYHEYIAGVVVRRRDKRRFGICVTHIGVDSLSSLWGGREIWGVPKEMAHFDLSYGRDGLDCIETATDESGRTILAGEYRTRIGLPRRLRVPVFFPNYQELDDRIVYSDGTFRGALQLCASKIDIPHDSPLAALGIAGRKPLVNFGVPKFQMYLRAPKPVR